MSAFSHRQGVIDARRLLAIVAIIFGISAGLVGGLSLTNSETGGRWVHGLTPVGAREVTHFESLSAMARQSQLVVMAEVQRVEFSRSIGDENDTVPYAVLELSVREVFAGTFPKGTLRLEVLLSKARQVEELRPAVVGAVGIFFLKNKGDELAALGADSIIVDANQPFHRLESSQGAWHNHNGVVDIPEAALEDSPFLRKWAGRPFDEAEQEIRRLTGSRRSG